jgi:pimeloyl-ACP methyl ester carboxylesterase
MSKIIEGSLKLLSGIISYKYRKGEPCIVFLHGLSGSKEYFKNGFHSTFIQDYGILTIDIPGFGNSKVTNGDYTMSSQASRIFQLVEALELNEIYLVGHSYSGPICLLLYKLLPQKIKGIILVESSIRPGEGSWALSIASQTFEEYQVTHLETCRKSYEFYEEGLVDKCEAKVQVLVQALEKTSAEAMYYCSKELVDFCFNTQLVKEFSCIEIPICYFLGSIHEKNLETSPVLLDLIKSGIDVKIIERSGHCMMLDNPDHFYQSISEFVGKNGQQLNGDIDG